MSLRQLTGVVAAIGLAIVSPAFAQSSFPAFKGQTSINGKWKSLIQYIGDLDYEKVIRIPLVKREFQFIAGSSSALVLENLQVRGGIDFVDGGLLLQGLKPHSGNFDEAAVWIGLDGSIDISLLHNGKVEVFTRQSKFEYLPLQIKLITYLYSLSARNKFVTFDEVPGGAIYTQR